MTTNSDAALISVLYEAQCPESQKKRVGRCLLRRPFKTKVISSANPGTQFAAAISLLMAATKIEDHIQDNETCLRFIPGISTRLAQRWKQAAQKTAKALGFNANVIETQVRQQRQIETQPNQDFSLYAGPTGISVGTALSHTAVIASRPQNADILFDIGRSFGRVMYLLDSYKDYAADSSLGRFNALAACFAKEEIREQATGIFRQAFYEIGHLFSQLDLSQPFLAWGLLTRQLKRTGDRILGINECATCNRRPPDRTTLATLKGAVLARQTHKQEPRVTESDIRRLMSQGVRATSKVKQDHHKKCPYCGQAVDKDSVICAHCGRAIAPPGESHTEQNRDTWRDVCCDCYDKCDECSQSSFCKSLGCCLEICCECSECLDCCS